MCRSVPQMPATCTRTIASPSSSRAGVSASATPMTPVSCKTTACTLDLVLEVGVDAAGEPDELVGRLHVAHDRREVAAHAQLALHHPLDRVELPLDNVLPAGVRRRERVRDTVDLSSVDGRRPSTPPVPEVEVAPKICGHVAVGLGHHAERDVPLPVGRGLAIGLGSVDLATERLEPLLAREYRHPAHLPGVAPGYGTSRQCTARMSTMP